jgi:hypothetical protein
MLHTEKGWVYDGIYSKEDAEYWLKERKKSKFKMKIERVK